MSVVQEVRQGRVGRFPVWLVAVVLAGVAVLGFTLWSRVKKHGATTGDAVNLVDDTADSVAGIPSTAFADEIGGAFPQNVSMNPLPSRPHSNSEWLIAAADFLVGLGREPLKVQQALQDYLSGNLLTAEEQDLINTAIKDTSLGLPPEGVLLASSGGAPSTSSDYVDAPLNTNLYDWSRSKGVSFEKLFGSFKYDPTCLNPKHRNYMDWNSRDSSGRKIPKFLGSTPPVRIR